MLNPSSDFTRNKDEDAGSDFYALKGSLTATEAIDTNWIVITGAPSSGKSTLIEMLSQKGFTTSEETGREYINQELAKGRTIQEIRSEPSVLQSSILTLSLSKAIFSDPTQLTFFDRGIPDSVVYWEFNKLDPSVPLRASSLFRYRHVFILDSVGFHDDGVRCEDGDVAAHLDRRLYQVYKDLGYDPVRIPKLPTEQRIELILNHLR